MHKRESLGEGDVQRILSHYPFPIAASYRKVQEQDNLTQKALAIFETYQYTLTYLSLILLCLQYERGNPDTEVVEAFHRCRRLPWNSWLEFFQLALQKSDKSLTLVAHIEKWCDKIEREQTVYLREIVEYRYIEQNLGQLTNLMGMNQTLIPSLGILEEKELEQYCDFYRQSLDSVISRLQFLADFPLYWIEGRENGKYSSRKLAGADRNFLRTSITSETPLVTNNVYLQVSAERFLSLHPFVVHQECYYCIREELLDTFETFFFQSHSSRRVCYTGPIHNVALREHIETLSDLFSQKNGTAKVAPSVKDVWEKAFQITEESLTELKNTSVFSSRFFARKDAMFRLRNFIENPRYPVFAMIGSKGVGKTTLLAEMARRWSSTGNIVFFLRVFGNRGSNLCDYFARTFGDGQILDQLDKEEARWIIILDGIENAHSPKNLLVELNNFAQKYHDKVRIIISAREMILHCYKKYFSSNLFMPIEGDCPLIESHQRHFLLTTFSPEIGKDIYQTIAADKVGPITPYDSFPRNIKGILCNPTIIRLFLWALKNRELPRHLGLRDIMEGFVMHHVNSTKQRREFVERFTEVLIRKRLLRIDLDELVETDDPLLVKEALSFTGNSPLQELVREGVLERTGFYDEQGENLLMHFPMEIVREYMVYRTIALSGKHGDEFLINYFREVKDGNLSLMGVIYFALVRLADKYYFDRLAKVINSVESPNPFARQVLLEILLFKERSTSGRVGHGGAIDDFVDAILEEPSQEGTLALADFATRLYGEKKYFAAACVFEKLIPHFVEPVERFDALFFTILAAQGYQHCGEGKKAVKLYKRCYKLLKKVENTDREVEIYCFLGRAHREMGDMERAHFFMERCKLQLDKVKGHFLEAEILEECGFVAEKQGNTQEALKYFAKQRDALESISREDKVGNALENIARLSYADGKKEEAVELLEEAVEIFHEMGNLRHMAYCKQKLGRIWENEKKYQESIKTLLEALVVFESLEEQGVLAETYMSLGRLYDLLEKKEESKDYFNKAMHSLREVGDNRSLAECFERFGQIDFNQGNLKEAVEKFNKAMEIYRRLNHQQGLGNVFHHLGNLCKAQGDIAKAYQYYNESLKIRHALQDLPGIAETCNSLVIVLAHNRKLPEAMKKLQECRKIYKELKDSKGLAATKTTEALLYKLQGDNSKALQCYQECVEILEPLHEQRLLGTIYNSIGLIYKERGDFYNALANFERSAKLQKSANDLSGLAASYNNIGLIYDAKNDYEKALEFYGKDLEITKKLGDRQGLATSYNNIAILHYNHRNYARALWYLEKSIPIYEEIGDKKMIAKVKERIQYVREKL